jgi:hypothetical protein
LLLLWPQLLTTIFPRWPATTHLSGP